jgi:UDP-N-acetylmuramoyl-tripeptide--D-alanyl-D-alanine ligase
MPFFDAHQLEPWTHGRWSEIPRKRIRGFSIDARKIDDGELFVAVKAARDGHDYIKQAQEAGARGAIVDRYVEAVELPQLIVQDTVESLQEIAKNHRNQYNIPIVGITGSCGKTSTKEALSNLLPDSLSTVGNLNNHLGVPLTLLRIDSSGHQYAVIEAGINKTGDMDELQQMIQPSCVIITMIGSSHLQGLVDENGVAEEKIKLWTSAEMSPWAFFPEHCLAFNCFQEAIKERQNYTILKAGKPNKKFDQNEAFFEISTETNELGGSCVLKIWCHESPVLSINIPAVSDGMGSNLALAVLTALYLGVSDKDIFERLPQYRPSTLRGNRLQGRGCEYFVDCYNANPSSMVDSIQYFQRASDSKKKLLVLGGMEELGENGPSLHRKTGASIMLEEQDKVVLIGEKASWMADGLIDSGASDHQVLVLNKLEDARAIIEDFNGNILFKGSRSNSLEKLVPFWATESHQEPLFLKC